MSTFINSHAGKSANPDRRIRAFCCRLPQIVLLLFLELLAPDFQALRAAQAQSVSAEKQLAQTPAARLGASPAALVSPITRVDRLRALTPVQAAGLVPVQLTGLVTDMSGYKNSFFFQDPTGGVSVDRTDSAVVHTGDLVQLTGTSSPGLFAPVVLASKVVVTGRAPHPHAPRVTLADLMGGAEDSQWVEEEGIVHSAEISQVDGHTVLMLRLDIGGAVTNVLIHDFTAIDFHHLVDARVRFRGVCASDFNEKRQFVGLELYVPDRHFMEILEPAPLDPFLAATIPIANVLQFGKAQHRVKISGISTWQNSARTAYLQDGADGIEMQVLSTQKIEPGHRIEAVGFPVLGEYAPALRDAVFRDLGPAAPVPPSTIQFRNVITQQGDFFHTPYDQQLIRIQGIVDESYMQAGNRVWLLRDGKDVFAVYLPASPGTIETQYPNGSRLSVTGICVIHVDSNRNPVSFSILARTPRDITVLERASWWSLSHTLAVLVVFASLLLIITLWVVVLRHRVEQQTRIIRQSEERFRILAQHDYLTGLPNRLMLEEQIDACLAECRSSSSMAAVFTIDIDFFKRINDTFGHLAGDECLKYVAARLRTVVRKSDVIARTGGEEFTLVIGSLPTIEAAHRIASSMLALFQEPVRIESGSLPAGAEQDFLLVPLTVSIGASLYPLGATDSFTLRRLSDQALYSAKNSGRNCAIFSFVEEEREADPSDQSSSQASSLNALRNLSELSNPGRHAHLGQSS